MLKQKAPNKAVLSPSAGTTISRWRSMSAPTRGVKLHQESK